MQPTILITTMASIALCFIEDWINSLQGLQRYHWCHLFHLCALRDMPMAVCAVVKTVKILISKYF